MSGVREHLAAAREAARKEAKLQPAPATEGERIADALERIAKALEKIAKGAK